MDLGITRVATQSGDRGTGLTIGIAILWGAFLLFLLEPMIGKMILPWFGGTAEVWTGCLLFFQAALLGGYLYAHYLTRLAPATQRLLHLVLLALSLFCLPITPAAAWRPAGGEAPLPLILGLLATTIGAPFVLLSATGPLLQVWVSQHRPAGPPPYRLFALSNLGSLLGLLAYPFLIEPALTTVEQARLWSLLYVGLVSSCALAAWMSRPAVKAAAVRPARTLSASRGAAAEWFLLAMAPSAMLLAITNHISQNVAAIPLLWVVSLVIYLLSFILCFESGRWYRRPLFLILFTDLLPVLLWATVHDVAASLGLLLPLFFVGLFTVAMLCHGELAARRPAPDRLTGFYLVVAAGGAAGGVLVGALAPLLLDALFDLPLLLSLTALLLIVVFWRARSPGRHGVIFASAFLAWAGLTLWAGLAEHAELGRSVTLERDFYGALRVTDEPPTAAHGAVRREIHGTISHGEEFLDPALAMLPTTYFGPLSGAGRALGTVGETGPIRVGVIGLGAGTLAAYGRPGDVYRFYEIDPAVVTIAERDFHFLERCQARWDIVLGDGRLQLEAEPAQLFDVLIIDAFSSDAIPVHLLTREAMALYVRHLTPRGLLVFQVSNQHLNAAPVVAAAAAAMGRTARYLRDNGDAATDGYASEYVVVAADPGQFEGPRLAAAKPIAVPEGFRPWTDDYSNLWRSLR